jgi:hypothetical protein
MFGFLAGLVPAVVGMVAAPFGLRTRADETTVRAIYLFHRSGDPLVTVASDSVRPLESSQLEPVLGAVREFVESEEDSSRRMLLTKQRFGEEGVVGVRGQFVSACVVYRGHGDGILRRDLTRFVREFEERNGPQLETWEAATSLAGDASLALVGLMDNRGVSESVAPTSFAVAAN